MLTFGGASSRGIYNDAAKPVKEFAMRASSTDNRMLNQILDDVICVGSARDGTVGKFYDTYRQIAEEMGWWILEDKPFPILSALQMIVGCDEMENGQVMSVKGKLNHYIWLVPEGPWQRGFLHGLQDATKPSGSKMTVGTLAKEQADWWIVNLRAAAEE